MLLIRSLEKALFPFIKSLTSVVEHLSNSSIQIFILKFKLFCRSFNIFVSFFFLDWKVKLCVMVLDPV